MYRSFQGDWARGSYRLSVCKKDNVKIGKKGKRVKMARWWGRLGGETVTHVASPRLIDKLHEAASQSVVPNISAK